MVSLKGLPYLVGNQELIPKTLVPDYSPNKANPFERPFFEVTFVVSHKRDYCIHYEESLVHQSIHCNWVIGQPLGVSLSLIDTEK